MEMNRTLEMQIEALRLRLDFDAKHHEHEKAAILSERERQVKEKDDEIESLHNLLRTKEGQVGTLTTETQMKSENMLELQMHVDELRTDVNSAKTYSKELQKELALLQDQKNRLENGNAYKDKENEICLLETGINELKTSMSMLLGDLEKAKQTIATQSSMIRYLENDKRNIQVKFKEELLKATRTMRHEIEKIRDVMNGQWREMKHLREQNNYMGCDLKQIREMLEINSVNDNREKAERVHQRNPVYSNTFATAFKPTLPSLTKDTRRIYAGKKK